MRGFACGAVVLLLLPLAAAAAGPASRPALDPVLPEVDFRATPLDKAVDALRDQSNVNIVVRWAVLEAAGVKRATPVDLRLKGVSLQTVLALLGEVAARFEVPMVARPDRGVVILSTRDDLENIAVVRVYDVRDLIEADMLLRAPPRDLVSATTPAAAATMPATTQATQTIAPTAEGLLPFVQSLDRLRQAVLETVEPMSWRDAGGTVGAIYEFNGRLVVTQTPAAHERVVRLLDDLRRGGGQTHAKGD